MQNGAVQAFIHIGYYQDENENNEKEHVGVIRFLGYERGARSAGQAVLEKAETYLKTFDVSRIIAFSKMSRYRFYHFEYAQLSDTLEHIHALLGLNDYHQYHGQVFMDWENFKIDTATVNSPVTLSTEWQQGRGKRPNCYIKAYQDNQFIGQCDSISCGEYSTHPDAQDWVYTHWIGVEDEYQGQGLGKYLLQYSLQEMHKVGYRHAALSTDWNNYRALLFYSNFGYRAVDWTYAYEKVLSEAPQHE